MTVYKLCFYVPEDHVEAVKTAVFEAGAGRIGNYDCCSFQVRGQGQFRPLEGSNPHLGEHGEIETVDEFRVEMICTDDHLKAALSALRLAHPYEEPAIDLWRLEDLPG
ncbi:Nif3-like dinuclear metal center hexameric protein [Alloalcanivorax profundimaris]|uniref:Nif3-like dinuclear metal center hexameric protein n=1 Tax=Alloalcanivorax profundimaris TaxID=2735259 RepID=UPI0018892F22|nr:YqfO family protein [Alloalcanivorax profundimaris]MBF1803573.1 NGG1p interacting factor NIF3 [Alloalcanivorax profundimaris]MCQ6261501.1 YqfO family protein [Alcanivorax sp. MM125-6]